jgi:hypothetical protein
MKTLLRAASLAAGVATGLAMAIGFAACCPETKDIVWDVKPGSYEIDPRLQFSPTTPYPALGTDTSYHITISADGSQATESYERDGRYYEAVYRLGPAQPNEMRSDVNLSNE